jgi:adenine-specific DNA-methyltransferase
LSSKYERYSKEELVRIIEERDRKPKFGLVWERDEIDHDRSLNQDFVALDLLAEHSSGAEPWANLLIEGDNFDALRYLRMTHAGKVKCICIDPPYNTGNKDFIYNDRFIDKDTATSTASGWNTSFVGSSWPATSWPRMACCWSASTTRTGPSWNCYWIR